MFRSIFCHCKVGHFIVGELIGVLLSLLASSSCMGSEASRERMTRARGGRKESLQRSLKNFYFCFAQIKRNTIG